MVARGLAAQKTVPGRLERVDNDAGVLCVVDYAHTPDALERALQTLRPLTRGRLLVVFGCGGDRDPTKRPVMGEAAVRLGDVVLVTSDNPRTEDPGKIVQMVLEGVRRAGGVEVPVDALAAAARGYTAEVDRRTAIRRAVAAARAGRHSGDRRQGARGLPDPGHDEDSLRRSRGGGRGVCRPAGDAAGMTGPAHRPLDRACQAMGGVLLSPASGSLAGRSFAGAATDNRLVAHGRLFFALKGERVDGFDFCAAAAKAGAAALVVPSARGLPGGVGTVPVIGVADPRSALVELARAVRAEFTGQVVGITGSNGKTTTKELVAAALQTRSASGVGDDGVLRTAGNLNTDIGLPLTVLESTGEERFWVLEMAMRARGEIAYLADIANPHVGLVTNVAAAHLGRLGSLAEVARAKGEIFSGLAPGGIAVLPADEPLLEAEAAHLPESRKRRFAGGERAVRRRAGAGARDRRCARVGAAAGGGRRAGGGAVAAGRGAQRPQRRCRPGGGAGPGAAAPPGGGGHGEGGAAGPPLAHAGTGRADRARRLLQRQPGVDVCGAGDGVALGRIGAIVRRAGGHAGAGARGAGAAPAGRREAGPAGLRRAWWRWARWRWRSPRGRAAGGLPADRVVTTDDPALAADGCAPGPGRATGCW